MTRSLRNQGSWFILVQFDTLRRFSRQLCRHPTDQREDPLPERTTANDVDGGGCPVRGFVDGYEGEVHGEFDASKPHGAPLIIPIIAQIGFTGGRKRMAVPVLDRRERIQASGG